MGEIISFLSGKGGTGKSVVAASVAANLAKDNKNVLIVDCNVGFRCLDMYFNVSNEIVYDFYDILNDIASFDDAVIKDFGNFNLTFLAAPQNISYEKIDSQKFANLLKEKSEEYEYIILDLPQGFNKLSKNLTISSNKCIIITDMDILSARNSDKIACELEKLQIENVFFAINKIQVDLIQKNDMIDIDELISIVGVTLIGVIPFEENVMINLNKGILLINDKKSRFNKAIENISGRIQGKKIAILKDEKKSFFGF